MDPIIEKQINEGKSNSPHVRLQVASFFLETIADIVGLPLPFVEEKARTNQHNKSGHPTAGYTACPFLWGRMAEGARAAPPSDEDR